MKIMYLTARQPYPYTKGDQHISYSQIKQLSQKHEIYLVSFYEKDDDKCYREMKQYCAEVHLFKLSAWKKVVSALKVMINPTSLQANIYYHFSLQKKVDDLYQRIKPDVVHILSFRMAQYFLYKDINKSLDLIDAYSLNMKKRRDSCRNILKVLWHFEYQLLNRYERKIIADYRNKTIVAKRDWEYFQDQNIVINPIGIEPLKVKTNHNRYFSGNGNIEKEHILQLIFQGNMSYYPNIQAIRFLVNELLPEIKKSYGKVKLYLVGGNPSKEIQDLQSNQVAITGYVEDVSPYLMQADMAIYPIFTATGMQTKILEALSCHCPCIVTPQCREGIAELEDGVNILLADGLQEFMDKISFICNNKEAVEEIAQNGYNLIMNKYSWERNTEVLEKLWCKDDEIGC